MEKLKRFGKLRNILKLYTTGMFFSYREIEEMKRKHENEINLRIGEYAGEIEGGDAIIKYLKEMYNEDIVGILHILSEIDEKIPESPFVDLILHGEDHMDHKGNGYISGDNYRMFFKKEGVMLKPKIL
ncbi:MAG: hypothetical protein J7J38_03010 [Candidatus Aenigmarchaeota archaeon]|nr:hypothetical protein [Candidatus Aenigmarchaeota archaeon]